MPALLGHLIAFVGGIILRALKSEEGQKVVTHAAQAALREGVRLLDNHLTTRNEHRRV